MPAESSGSAARDDPLAALAAAPEVAAALARARRAVDDLRGHRVLRRSAPQVSAESALRGARASAALAGADLPLDVVRRTLAAAGQWPAPEAAMVAGAVRVAVEVGRLAPTWQRAPLQALARLHALAATDAAPAAELGRPAPGTAPRLVAVGHLLSSASPAPALVVAAVVHGEIESAGAFPVGAGLVARAAFRLTVLTRGLDPAGVSVPEVGHVELGAEAYRAALDGYRTGAAPGVAAWVVHCAEAVVLGAREGLAVCEAIRRGG